MAKDVDLSSKEWCDIVFEGKNKEFGAYEMRRTSPNRHNKAVLIVLIALAVVLALLIASVTGLFSGAPEEETVAVSENVLAQIDEATEEQEEEPEEQQIEIPEPEIPQVEEDVIQQLLTESVIVEQVDEDKKLKDQEQIKEDESMISIKNVETGAEDFSNQEQLKAEVVVVEEPKPAAPEKIWEAVEQKPEFPGGDAALYKFLGDNMQYPPAAAEEGVQGTVVVRFVVERDGSIGQVSVVRGKHPALDKEATRVVKKLPKFLPGKQNGQTVRVYYTLPVKFKLQN